MPAARSWKLVGGLDFVTISHFRLQRTCGNIVQPWVGSVLIYLSRVENYQIIQLHCARLQLSMLFLPYKIPINDWLTIDKWTFFKGNFKLVKHAKNTFVVVLLIFKIFSWTWMQKRGTLHILNFSFGPKFIKFTNKFPPKIVSFNRSLIGILKNKLID